MKLIYDIFNKYSKYSKSIEKNLFYTEDKSIIKYYNPFNHYVILSELSNDGYFSIVYNVKHKVNNEIYVMKVYSPMDMSALNEIKILFNYPHNTIVKLYESFLYQNRYYLILKKCSGGNLYNHLLNNYISEKNIKYIVHQMLTGVKFLHENNIIVKDIKLENIFLSNSNKYDIILGDFNLSIILSDKYKYTNNRGGTLYYASPEVLSNNNYSFQSDIWSIGVVMYILLSRKFPFYNTDDSITLKKIRDCDYNFNGSYWKNISSEAKDLLVNIFQVNIQNRYTINDIINHKWFKN